MDTSSKPIRPRDFPSIYHSTQVCAQTQVHSLFSLSKYDGMTLDSFGNLKTRQVKPMGYRDYLLIQPMGYHGSLLLIQTLYLTCFSIHHILRFPEQLLLAQHHVFRHLEDFQVNISLYWKVHTSLIIIVR